MGETDDKSKTGASALSSELGASFGKSLGDYVRSSFDFSGASKAFRDAMPESGLNVEAFGPRYEPIIPQFEEYTSDFRSYWHQLVVIGNGFDLECGLPSRFKDFFDSRHPQPIRHEPTFGKTDPYSDYRDDNAWEFILNCSENHNWYDVEGTIADWIGRKTDDQPTCPQRLRALIGCLNDPAHKMVDGDYRVEFEVVRRLLCAYGDMDVWDEEKVLKVLRKELKNLEDDFDAYLSKAVDELSSYKESAQQLAIELMHHEMPDKDSYDAETSILSFNYTNSFGRLHTDDHDVDIVNIHGKLGGEIVFGIDGTGIMDDSLRAPFTKTYRLMSLDVPDTGKLVHAASGNAMNVGTAIIKFYGHSLGEADYSYFQALFDSVKLYEGDTRLIFYFRPPKGEDGSRGDVQEARASMMDRVVHLLTSYGNTLDNKDHGRNLIHKLLLEGRLSVRELPDTMRKKESFTENGVTFS
jgi:hypothetical protein